MDYQEKHQLSLVLPAATTSTGLCNAVKSTVGSPASHEPRWATLVKESVGRVLGWWHNTWRYLKSGMIGCVSAGPGWQLANGKLWNFNLQLLKYSLVPPACLQTDFFQFPPRKEIVTSKWPPAANLLKTQQLSGHTSLAMPRGKRVQGGTPKKQKHL